MTSFTERPPTLAGSLATIAALVAVVFTTPGGPTALGLAALGVPVLAVGAFRGRRLFVSFGGLLLAGGAILGGVVGTPVASVLAGMAAAFVAWDVGEHGTGLGEQVGNAARSRHAVVAHAAGSTLVAAVTTLGGVGLYSASPSGRPFSALLLLVLGAVILAVALTE